MRPQPLFSLLLISLGMLITLPAAADITGVVYNDANQNAIQDPGEPGIGGVVVRAWDDNNTIIDTATSSATGAYTLSGLGGATTYRVEAEIPTALSFLAPSAALAATDDTSVVFALGNDAGVDFAMHAPADWCNSSPDVVTTCFAGGPITLAGADTVASVVSVPHAPTVNGTGETALSTHDLTGAVWGVAVDGDPDQDPTTDDALIFAASYGKRHSGWGPGPVGATAQERAGTVYVLDRSSPMPLATIVIPNAAAAVPTPRDQGRDPDGAGAGAPEIDLDMEWDSAFFGRPGKEGLGDIELGDDALFVVNLFDRNLYRVDLSGGVGAATVASLGAIPGPGCPGGDTGGAVGGDWRPFALAMHHGELYIGGVCSGETNNASPIRFATDDNGTVGDLTDDFRVNDNGGVDNIGQVQAHVFRVTSPLTGGALTTESVFSLTDMSFNRGGAGLFATEEGDPDGAGVQTPYLNDATGRWHAWVGTFDKGYLYMQANTFRYSAHYPQPMLTDIEFDSDGSMILGFRDRSSDQIGQQAFNPGLGGNGDFADPADGSCSGGPCVEAAPGDLMDGDPFWENNTQGDINRVCWTSDPLGGQVLDGVAGAWAWEGTGGCAFASRRSPGEHPPPSAMGTSEWYYRDDQGRGGGDLSHHETSLGGLALAPRFTEVVNTVMNPHDFSSGGIRYLTNATGDETGAHEIYDGTVLRNFGKGAGLGDVELLCTSSPVQIGNRVWIDDGPNAGIQDPSESTVPDGTTVNLYDSTNTLVGQTTTVGGHYVFGGPLGSGMLGANRLVPGETYRVTIAPADWPAGTSPTTANANGDSEDQRDSDGSTLAAPGQPYDGHMVAVVVAGAPGENDHQTDFGFTRAPARYDLALRKVPAGATTVEPGDLVPFTITIFNQGTVDASGIEINDYVDLADFEPFNLVDNPPGTTAGGATLPYSWVAVGSDGRAAIVGVLPAGASMTLPVNLAVRADAIGALQNFAEIAADDGDDDDSTVEDDQGNGGGDVLVDNEINGAGGDEDDHDVAVVVIASVYTVPTLGGWGMILLVLGLMLASLRRLTTGVEG